MKSGRFYRPEEAREVRNSINSEVREARARGARTAGQVPQICFYGVGNSSNYATCGALDETLSVAVVGTVDGTVDVFSLDPSNKPLYELRDEVNGDVDEIRERIVNRHQFYRSFQFTGEMLNIDKPLERVTLRGHVGEVGKSA